MSPAERGKAKDAIRFVAARNGDRLCRGTAGDTLTHALPAKSWRTIRAQRHDRLDQHSSPVQCDARCPPISAFHEANPRRNECVILKHPEMLASLVNNLAGKCSRRKQSNIVAWAKSLLCNFPPLLELHHKNCSLFSGVAVFREHTRAMNLNPGETLHIALFYAMT